LPSGDRLQNKAEWDAGCAKLDIEFNVEDAFKEFDDAVGRALLKPVCDSKSPPQPNMERAVQIMYEWNMKYGNRRPDVRAARPKPAPLPRRLPIP
jgi:hypothetical protein